MLGLIKALIMMLKAHKGQKDKAGRAYIFHPLYVALSVKGIRTKEVALLHDVLEDSNIYNIRDFDFLDDEQREALLLLVHDKNQDYFDYINSLKSNKIAVEVKKADLKHNSNLKRLKVITEKDIKRKNKYSKAVKLLI